MTFEQVNEEFYCRELDSVAVSRARASRCEFLNSWANPARSATKTTAPGPVLFPGHCRVQKAAELA